MPGVSNGQTANETTFNAAFMARNGDTDTNGIVGLLNTAPASISDVTNLQQFVKESADALGYTGEGDTTRKNYSDNTIVANGDDRKVAIGKLSAAFKESGSPACITSVHNTDDGVTFQGKLTFVDGDNIGITANGTAKTISVYYTGKLKTYLQGVVLPDNTITPTVLAAVVQSVVNAFEVDINVKRGPNWLAGRIMVIDNGDGTARTVPNYVETGDCGIVWTSTIETLLGVPALTLKYTTTSTGVAPHANYEYNHYDIPA